ncbi:MAG: ribonuclease R family protein [Campylobacterota bacterium]|nr:ribonuclease R family protein [Campylobacterota bacterium]
MNHLLEKLYKTQNKPIVKLIDGNYRLNSKYKIGNIELSNKTAILKLSNSSAKIFIDIDDLNGAYQYDKVLVQINFNPKGKTKARVIEILDRSDNRILCYVENYNLFSVKEGVLIDCDSINNRDGDIVIFNNGKISNILGNIAEPKIDEKISLYLYNEYYRLDTQEFKFEKLDTSNRIDLTNLDFCTIDPASAKDHDDAIYFDKKTDELYVAIADVSAYVKDGDHLDIEAFKRSFSIYLPNKVLPMLPFELSTDLCSLVPNKVRPAFVFKIKLDLKNSIVLNSTVFEAIIESKHKYSYEFIDDVLKEKDEKNRQVQLYEITKKFRDKRLKNGYDFRSDEIRLILDDDENLQSYNTETSSPSHSLVEECMLLANQEAAKKLKTLGIFRIHDEPTPNKIKKLLGDVNALGIKAQLKSDVHSTIVSIQQKSKNVDLEQEVDELIIQSQQQASYSSIKKEHFGLGFKNYSHFTSPIRRYSDLILHRILKTGKVPKGIEDICEQISIKEREIASLVWDYEDRKYARYLNKNIHKNFIGKIVDIENCIVKLDDIKVKGARVYLENYSGQKLFTQVEVKIKSSDIISKKIIAELL